MQPDAGSNSMSPEHSGQRNRSTFVEAGVGSDMVDPIIDFRMSGLQILKITMAAIRRLRSDMFTERVVRSATVPSMKTSAASNSLDFYAGVFTLETRKTSRHSTQSGRTLHERPQEANTAAGIRPCASFKIEVHVASLRRSGTFEVLFPSLQAESHTRRWADYSNAQFVRTLCSIMHSS
jgi:hypothetical protein